MQRQVNGIRVNYELGGPEGAPVVMLSHSLACNLFLWDPQLTALGHYRVLRYDTRGHGGSDASPEPYTLELLADDAVGLLDALGLDQVHWVGLSLGGMIGQTLALRRPERLRSLSLCDTAARLPADAQPIWQQRIELAREQGMEALVDDTLARWFTADFLAADPPPVKLTRQYILATPVTGYIGCCEAIRGLDTLDRLGQIALPTLVVVGDQDPSTPPAAAEAIHERIPGSRLEVLTDASHLSNLEQATAFNRVLTDFLRQHLTNRRCGMTAQRSTSSNDNV